jgi:hypothetical protein|tara:strand:- start:110 stop:322 length:213 start_codon:yes stop_codon:yes gene_type:complete
MGEAAAAAQPQKGKMEFETSTSTHTKTSVAELTKMTENKLRVSKRNKKEDVDMTPKISLKSKGIKKQCKK